MSWVDELALWEHPQCYIGSTWEGWYVGLGRTRDSGCLCNVNFEVFYERVCAASDKLSILHPNIGMFGGEAMEIDSVYIVRESHWAYGWVEWIAIHQDDVGAVEEARRLIKDLSSYPSLDDDRWSDRECEEVQGYWKDLSIRGRVELCQECDESVFAARRDYPPQEVESYLRSTWN